MVHPDDYRFFDTLCTVDDKYNLGPDSTRIVKVGRTTPPYTVKIDSIMFRYIDGIMDMLYYVRDIGYDSDVVSKVFLVILVIFF